MAAVSVTGFLVIALLKVPAILSSPEPIFRPEGGQIELGFCFGADYIAGYKSGPGGDLLLGNSSHEVQPPEPASSLAADLRSRVTATHYITELLGLEIHALRRSDSGVYRWECWKDQRLVNKKEHRLSVCLQEGSYQEVSLLPGGAANLRCKLGPLGPGWTIRWYHEVKPSKTRTLFLDTGVSQGPLLDDLRGHMQVSDNGSLLHILSEMVMKSQSYYCLVMEGERCHSFQKLVLPSEPEAQAIFRSVGEGVLLPCLSQDQNQELGWDTPFGRINQTSRPGAQRGLAYMFDGKSRNHSLAIPFLSVNHSGVYTCLSRPYVTEYLLYVCPELDPDSAVFGLGDRVVLNCDPVPKESSRVLWYRHTRPQQDILIVDSEDSSLPVPKELRGRVNMSELNSSLLLFNLSSEDNGEYWCVVLSGYDYMDGDSHLDGNIPLKSDDYPESEDYPESDDYSHGEGHKVSDDINLSGGDSMLWEDDYVDQCISRRRTILTYVPKRNNKDSTLYTVSAVIISCVILGIICAVVTVLWKTRIRASQSHKSRQTAEGTEDTALSDRLAPAENCP